MQLGSKRSFRDLLVPKNDNLLPSKACPQLKAHFMNILRSLCEMQNVWKMQKVSKFVSSSKFLIYLVYLYIWMCFFGRMLATAVTRYGLGKQVPPSSDRFQMRAYVPENLQYKKNSSADKQSYYFEVNFWRNKYFEVRNYLTEKTGKISNLSSTCQFKFLTVEIFESSNFFNFWQLKFLKFLTVPLLVPRFFHQGSNSPT